LAPTSFTTSSCSTSCARGSRRLRSRSWPGRHGTIRRRGSGRSTIRSI
jgi:hypothetical protein